MAEHTATVSWEFSGADFTKGQFSREHAWTFDGGARVVASASPATVPAPYVNAAGVDPEEAFIASISSCHMLTFLFFASRRGFQVGRYEDAAVGTTAKNDSGATWVNQVTLRPLVAYRGDTHPSPEEEAQLHHKAHEQCFIANSVKTAVTVSQRRA